MKILLHPSWGRLSDGTLWWDETSTSREEVERLAFTEDELYDMHEQGAPYEGNQTMSGFTIKDSGTREVFSGGMQRDTTEGKTNWSLIADGPMLKRWAIHLTNGAKKYAKRNWMLAEGQAELDRARESAFRHFMQFFNGDVDEDHAAAVFFNINEICYIMDKMKNEKS